MAPTLVFDGNSDGLNREFTKLIEQNKALEKAVTQASRSAEKGAKAASEAHKRLNRELGKNRKTTDELGRKAQQVWERTRTGTEKYNRELKELNTLLKAGKINQDTYNRAVAQMDKQFQGVGKTANTQFGKAAGSLKSFATGIVGIGSAAAIATGLVTALKAELESMRQRQERSRLEQLSVGEVFEELKINFQSDKSVKSGTDLESSIIKIAEDQHADVKDVAVAANSVLSAKGNLSNRQALDFLGTAFSVTKNQEFATELASRAEDIANQTGVSDPKAAIGFLRNIQAGARVTNLSQLGQNVTQPIGAGLGAGDSAEQGAELFTAMNQLMKDSEGRISSTATIGLIRQLKEFSPKESHEGKFIPVTQRQAFAAAGSSQERIQILQRSPELAKAFLETSSFEKKASTAVEELVRGTKLGRETLATAQRAIDPLGQNQVKNFNNLRLQQRSGRFQTEVDAERALESTLQQGRLGSDQARIASARRTLEKTFENIDLPGLDLATASSSRFNFDSDVAGGVAPEQAALNVLKGFENETFGPSRLTAEDAATVNRVKSVLQNRLTAVTPAAPNYVEQQGVKVPQQLPLIRDTSKTAAQKRFENEEQLKAELAEAKIKEREASIKLKEAQAAAASPDSASGRNVSQAERKQIDVLQDVLKELQLHTSKIDVKLQKNRNPQL